MRPYNLGRATNSIIASSRAVSLTGPNWKCRHKDAWNDQHLVFFVESLAFYQNTTPAQAPSFRATSAKTTLMKEVSAWIIEGNDGAMFARIRLQIINGDYKHGQFLIDVESNPTEFEISEVLSQLITANFVSYQLDTMKIFSLSARAEASMDMICESFKAKIYSMSLSFIPHMVHQSIYNLESETWYASPAGAKSLVTLSWLKKRLDRGEALKSLETKEKKRPWLFTLLTLGRKRRRNEKMIHPLDKIRNEY